MLTIDWGHWNGRRNRLPHLAGSIVWRSRWGRRFEVLAKLAGQGEETAACWCYSINAVAISTQIGVVCVVYGHTPGRRVLRSGFLLGFAALGRSLGALRRLAPAPSQDLVRSKGQNPKHQVGHHLRPSANSHAGGSVFVLQPAKHSLYRRPL